MEKEIKLKTYLDAGHGWTAVKRKLLEELNLIDKISGFSYENGKTVYLEEDCDAPLLFEALSEKRILPRIKYVNHGLRSVVRSYQKIQK